MGTHVNSGHFGEAWPQTGHQRRHRPIPADFWSRQIARPFVRVARLVLRATPVSRIPHHITLLLLVLLTGALWPEGVAAQIPLGPGDDVPAKFRPTLADAIRIPGPIVLHASAAPPLRLTLVRQE